MARNERPREEHPKSGPATAAVWPWVAAIVFGVLVAYANSFHGAFVFDDLPSIGQNASIRSLRTALQPPGEIGQTVAGRPLLNLTFALNYAVHGLDVRGYHVVNTAIHAAAALLLFGLARRAFATGALAPRFGRHAVLLAGLVAVLWALHPLQTAAVTYVVQRAESLAALLILLTVHAAARDRWWLAVAAAFAGVAVKETAVVAPVLVLLYDRLVRGEGFLAALRRRWPLYAGLAASWLLLGWLVLGGQGRGGTAGLETEIGVPAYALTQVKAVVLYLKLVLRPAPLVFDYGTGTVAGVGEIWWQALVLAALLGGVLWPWRRQPAAAFAASWFFICLAPSSSLVPVATQTMAEHRPYLALAGVVALLVAAGYRWLGPRVVWPAAAAAAICAVVTIDRNGDYASAEKLWTDTVRKYPANARAQSNLGRELQERGDTEGAIACQREAIRLKPRMYEAHGNLGVSLMSAGRYDEALEALREAVRIKPDFFQGNYNLASLLTQQRRPLEALHYFKMALTVNPDDAGVLNNQGNALWMLGRRGEAKASFLRAVQSDPGNHQALNNLGHVLLGEGRVAEAKRCFEDALRINPGYTLAQQGLAQAEAILRGAVNRGP